jgi:hypothetical protein
MNEGCCRNFKALRFLDAKYNWKQPKYYVCTTEYFMNSCKQPLWY